MDNKHLIRLARLRNLAARAGRPFDLMRFVEDRGFAHDTLAALMQHENEDLVVLSLEVLAQMKADEAPPPAPMPEPTPVRPPAPSAADERRAALESRYIGRLR
jgi:hypothetical protein